MERTIALLKLAQQGNALAKETLLKENIGLVWSVVKRFLNRGYETEDLFQIGCIGLIRCIDKFDVAFGVKFSTYAIPMIMGEIRRFLRDDGLVKVSRPLKELAKKAKFMQETLQQHSGKNPTISELAAALDTDVEELVVAMEAGFEVESLHSVVYQGDGSPVYLIDKLSSEKNESQKTVDYLALEQIINELPEKEKRIIYLRYFKDKTQTEVAKTIGVSQVQISRIEKKVLLAMRQRLLET